MTPEVKMREAWRKTLPVGAFLTLIESTVTGVPDAYLQIPVRVSALTPNVDSTERTDNIGLWLEFKVLPYQVSDEQINWWIRYIRAGGKGGVISPLPANWQQNHPQSTPTKARDRPTTPFEPPPLGYPSPNNTQTPHSPRTNSKDPHIGQDRSPSKPLGQNIGYWAMDGWAVEEIERINHYIKKETNCVPWSEWLTDRDLSR